jgi:hypothetical protein
MLNEVTEQLKKIQEIAYFSPLIGRFDLAIELKATEQQKLYGLVNKIRSLSGVTSIRTYTPTMGVSNPTTAQATGSLAIVLLQVNEPVQNVLQSLQREQVRNAFSISGEFDIIVTISGKNQDEVLSQVPKIAEIQGVKASETLLAYRPIWL